MHRSWSSRLRPLPWCLTFAPLLLLLLACPPASPPDGAASTPQTDEAPSAVQPVSLSSSRDPDQLFPPCNRYDNVQDLGPLPPLGETTERAFTESYEAHRYTLDIEAGDYVHVVVEQQNVDLVVSLLDGEGEGLLRVDSLYSFRGSEDIIWQSGPSTQLRLLVCGPKELAKNAGYQVQITTQRLASEIDSKRVDAFLDYHSAEAQRRRDTRASRHEALQLYSRAAEKWRAIDRGPDEALAMYGISRMHAELGEDLQSALVATEHATKKLLSEGDVFLASASRHRQGLILNQLGRTDEAVAQYELAIEMRRELGHFAGEMRSSANLASLLRRRGHFAESRDLLESALQIAKDLGNERQIGRMLHELGTYYRLLSDGQQGLETLQEALAIRQRTGSQGEIASTHHSIGLALSQLDRYEDSIPSFRKALEIYQSIGARREESNALNAIGSSLIELNRYETALPYYQKSLQISTEEQHIYGMARANLFLGWIKAETGDCSGAIDNFHIAKTEYQKISDVQGEALSLQNIAICHHWLGNLELSLEFGRKSIDMAEKTRLGAEGLSMSWRAKFFSSKRDDYDFLIDVLVQSADQLGNNEHLVEALETAERSKARSLLDSIRLDSSIVDPESKQKIDQIQGDLSNLLSRKLLVVHPDDFFKSIDPEARELLEQLEGVRRQATRHARDTQESLPLDLTGIRKLIGRDTTLLEFHVGYRESHLWIIDQDQIVHYLLPNLEIIKSIALRLHRTLSTKSRPIQTEILMEQLSYILFSDVVDKIKTRRILVASDGPLHYLPLDALPVPGQETSNDERIGDKFELIVTPSASVLNALRNRRLQVSSDPKREIILVADPVFNLDDARFESGVEDQPALESIPSGVLDRLTFSSEEIMSISNTAHKHGWNSFAHTGFEATKPVLDDIRITQAEILHLATHANFHTRQPELAHLAFSQFSQTRQIIEDSNLFAFELYDAHIEAKLVVLSACSGALGSDILGEGLVGLTQGFFRAGASQVVVSLWQVDDRATAFLMQHFYKGLLGDSLSPGEALWEAKKAMRQHQEWSSPYYWAGFSLRGDWIL